MIFEEKFKQAQQFVGKKIQVTGSPSSHRTQFEIGFCVEVVKTPDFDSVDFVLDNGTRYGMHLDTMSESECSGITSTFNQFVRTVKIVGHIPK